MSSKLIALFLTSVSLTSFSNTIKICNKNPDRAIYTANMRLEGNGNGWRSRGWYKVEADKCFVMDVGGYLGKFYLYAEDEFKETSWGESDVRFCVHKTDAFAYANGDSMACDQAGQKKVKSDVVDVKAGENEWTVAPNFTRLNFCNKNEGFPIYSTYAVKTDSGWNSRGWYKVDAKACRSVSIGKYEGPVQTHAEYNLGELSWGTGPGKYCVNRTQGFSITNADQEANCTASDLKMVSASELNATLGTNTVNFEPQSLKTYLRLCNDVASKTLFTSISLANGTNSSLKSTGWFELASGECKDFDMGGYSGQSEIYGEWNGGEQYWGAGPTNICVHRTQAFSIDDATNAAACSSDIAQKMVPTFRFDLQTGLNTFRFQE